MHREPEGGFNLLLIVHVLQYSFPRFVFFQITADPVNDLIVCNLVNKYFDQLFSSGTK